MEYIAKDGARLYYEQIGTGDSTIVWLHGNGEDHTCFEKQMDFARRYTLILLDSRGHGKSQMGKGRLTISRMADDVAGLITSLSLQNPAVVGFSDGGNVALSLALRYPEKVGRLILAGANLSPSGVKWRVQLPCILGWAVCGICALFSKKAKHHFKILNLMVTQPHIKPAQLRSIRTPTLVLAGEHDMIHQKHTEQIAKQIAYARLQIIKNSSHFVFDKPAKTTNRMIANFLQDTGF